MTCFFCTRLAGSGRSVSFFGLGDPINGRGASLAVNGAGIVAEYSTIVEKIVA